MELALRILYLAASLDWSTMARKSFTSSSERLRNGLMSLLYTKDFLSIVDAVSPMNPLDLQIARWVKTAFHRSQYRSFLDKQHVHRRIDDIVVRVETN